MAAHHRLTAGRIADPEVHVVLELTGEMAGGAYQLQTDAGLEVKKTLRSVVVGDE